MKTQTLTDLIEDHIDALPPEAEITVTSVRADLGRELDELIEAGAVRGHGISNRVGAALRRLYVAGRLDRVSAARGSGAKHATVYRQAKRGGRR